MIRIIHLESLGQLCIFTPQVNTRKCEDKAILSEKKFSKVLKMMSFQF